MIIKHGVWIPRVRTLTENKESTGSLLEGLGAIAAEGVPNWSPVELAFFSQIEQARW